MFYWPKHSALPSVSRCKMFPVLMWISHRSLCKISAGKPTKIIVVYIANVTVYIISTVYDAPIAFIPPLGSNRTIVVPIYEERPVGFLVFRPVVRDVDNPGAAFRYHLNSSVDGYLDIDPNSGN